MNFLRRFFRACRIHNRLIDEWKPLTVRIGGVDLPVGRPQTPGDTAALLWLKAWAEAE